MKSVLNTLQVFELIAEHQPISLKGLVDLTARPIANVQRSLEALKSFGWIKPESSLGNPQWQITHRFVSLAGANQLVLGLNRLARPYLIDIRDEYNEATFLTTFDLSHVTVLDFVDTTHMVRMVGGTAGDIPSYISSTGRACLALLSDAEKKAVLKNAALENIGDNQNTFIQKLELIKASGFAVVRGDWSPELTQVGSAIVDRKGKPVGGIGVSIPNHRLDSLDIENLGMTIKHYCSEISLQL